MSKVKLTKGELKKQRDALAQFKHFLPTLQLKKQQLQMKISSVRKQAEQKIILLNHKMDLIGKWAGLFCDDSVDLYKYITPASIKTSFSNIAGAQIEIFESIAFANMDYDLFSTPLWMDKAVVDLKEIVTLLVEVKILKNEVEVLNKELRTTTQRVNLFEKIKIPECVEHIRKIRIYLGDQQANAVGISKTAKKKIEAQFSAEMINN